MAGELLLEDYANPSPPVSWRARMDAKVSGWRFAVGACFVGASTVFLINISIAFWLQSISEGRAGRRTVFEGDCSKAKSLNTGFHIAINALSTILLASSSYCMQVISAPTRAQVDKAHSRRGWLNVGIMSFHNIRRAPRKRLIFFNSTLFLSIPNHGYYVYEIYENELNIPELSGSHEARSIQYNKSLEEQMRNGHLERLNVSSCIDAYVQYYQSRGHLALVFAHGSKSAIIERPAAPPHQRNLSPCWAIEAPQMQSPCTWSADKGSRDDFIENWAPFGSKIGYCLSERLPTPCKLNASLNLLLIVAALNFVKAICMLMVVFHTKADPLLTIGDAAVSFLNSPSPGTRMMCLLLLRCKSGLRPCSNTANVNRYGIAILVIVILLSMCILHATGGESHHTLLSFGLGEPTPKTTISLKNSVGFKGLIGSAAIVNTPHLLFSHLYFLYNSIFTALSTALEWQSFALNRKGMRVSTKGQGDQRSTYFLGLPYRIAVPLMMFSGLIHWATSQSLFLVDIDRRVFKDQTQKWTSKDASFGLGYSPIGIILTLALLVTMVVSLLVAGLVRSEKAMPRAANSSFAIAAACHPPHDQSGVQASTSKVQWGVTWYSEAKVGHCSFSSLPVTSPQEGRYYL
ncbi:hypothetical protein BS50DRAFT_478330 [Corynespora cassiicola Philippines]|uniref:DUF6536 domain-containing protein n=1 Tax=Corynespora cassiicola Philippines TaxID=1448308 RepID=A0A2T2PD78_CORCC|nr:hypothetical protein BS50DRAFT_478330 [Corynespora cassiicola Philippines]